MYLAEIKDGFRERMENIAVFAPIFQLQQNQIWRLFHVRAGTGGYVIYFRKYVKRGKRLHLP